MHVMIVGTVDLQPDIISIAEFDAPSYSTPEDIEADVKRLAKEYIIEDIKNGGEAMPYPYNFGDVCEMCYQDPNFQRYLADNGINYIETPSVRLYHVDHDEIWVSDYEPNSY